MWDLETRISKRSEQLTTRNSEMPRDSLVWCLSEVMCTLRFWI